MCSLMPQTPRGSNIEGDDFLKPCPLGDEDFLLVARQRLPVLLCRVSGSAAAAVQIV